MAVHAALGECVPLCLQQLRDMDIAALPVERVVLIENEASFLDYVEALRGRAGELVICGRGQSNWAVVTLLRHVARWFRREPARRVPVFHAGDLDRSGVLILRNLARHTGLAIAPLGMSVDVHRRHAVHGRALAGDERDRLHALLARDAPDSPGHDLLVEIARTGVWIEQEVFFRDVVLASRTSHDRVGTTGV